MMVTGESVQPIRRRMFLLLLRAFGITVMLTMVLLLILVALFFLTVGQDQLPLQPAWVGILEAYYLGNGDWEGVEKVLDEAAFSSDPATFEEWGGMILVDDSGQVVIDRGRIDTDLVGATYPGNARDVKWALAVAGNPVGTLVVTRENLPPLFRLLIPVGFISIFLGMLTVVVGLLLSRRVVAPLADVIGAAQAVSQGDLAARVEVRGPDDLRALTDSFNQMASALERNDTERRKMLTDIAHELRTPLTILQGKLEGIVDGIYPPDEAHIAPALEETYLLERLVEDLRLLTLAESRQLAFDLGRVNLSDLVHRVAELVAAGYAEQQLTLNLRLPDDLPDVWADEQRIAQVLGNLLNNAARYVPSGGRVEIAVQRLENSVEIAVIDNGPGVPEDELPYLFDRFWRGEKSRNRTAGGTGLGLSIARELVEAMGGTIRAANQPVGGLRLALTLPVQGNEGRGIGS